MTCAGVYSSLGPADLPMQSAIDIKRQPCSTLGTAPGNASRCTATLYIHAALGQASLGPGGPRLGVLPAIPLRVIPSSLAADAWPPPRPVPPPPASSPPPSCPGGMLGTRSALLGWNRTFCVKNTFYAFLEQKVGNVIKSLNSQLFVIPDSKTPHF